MVFLLYFRNTIIENKCTDIKKWRRAPKRGRKYFIQRQRTSQRPRPKLCQEDRTVAPTKTMKKRKTYRKNRHKLNYNLCMTYPFLAVCNEISCNECKNKCDNNQELIILSKQVLIQAQKDVLKEGTIIYT